MVPEVVLPNTDHHEQVQDGTRGCSTSAKYWPSWTTSRWYQRLFYFCQLLATMNNFKMVPEVVLLLPNTGHHEQLQGGTRGCSTSVKYWPPWTSSILFQRLFYCYQPQDYQICSRLCTLLITSHHEQVQDYTRDYFTATKFGLPWTRSRIWQRLLYFYQTLTTMNKFKITSNVVLLQYPMHWSPSIGWWWSLWHIYHGFRDF